MSFMVKKTGGQGAGGAFEALPEDTYPAVLIGIIDLGTHSEQFGDEPPRDVRKVLLAWEVIGEFKPGSKQHHVIGRDYACSLHEKSNLAKVVAALRPPGAKAQSVGEEVDISVLVGRPCLLTLECRESKSSGRKYNRVANVTGVPKGTNVGAPQNAPVVWKFEPGATLPEHPWLPFVYGEPCQEMIRRSREWLAQGAARQQEQPAAADAGGSDIPW